MCTSSSVSGARPLALTIVVLLALLLHGDDAVADAATTIGLDENFEDRYAAGVVLLNEIKEAGRVAKATRLWYPKSGAEKNETDPLSPVIAKRMAAVGSTHGFARMWLSGRCPRTASDGWRKTRRCYLREVRRLEEELSSDDDSDAD